MEATVELEDEELLLVEARRRRGPLPFLEELRGTCSVSVAIVQRLRSTGDRERVLVVLGRERVHRVPAVAVEVVALRARNEERVEPGLVDHRAHRVQAR